MAGLAQSQRGAIEQVAKHPVLAWRGHAAAFAAFGVLLQVAHTGALDSRRAVLMGTLVAAVIMGYDVRRSRER